MSTQEWIIPTPGMVITQNVSFMPGVYDFYNKPGITVAADDITINGNGAVLIGGKEKGEKQADTDKDEFAYGYKQMKNDSLGYHGIAIYSQGTTGVTLKNLSARNFEIGVKLERCNQWSIEGNDLSYNYHNPDHGWDEHEDLGGIVLYHTHHSSIMQNKANNVWSALVLRYSDGNKVINNDFSHTSNVGLRLWRACDNSFEDNDFSWGLRKDPGEIHARDSSCVLIETGSDRNRFLRNDMRFGGDGLFIRSLNGWMSIGNYFEENDTSFANNNAIEAWDYGNTYIRNKANYSSYGFWLGNSDKTVLIENEVAYNGTCFANAPENFGNSGIAVVNGSGNDFLVVGNRIHHNQGPGIALRNLPENPSKNWMIKDNQIFENANDRRGYPGYGIYMKNAENIVLDDNDIHDNGSDAVYCADNVRNVIHAQVPSDLSVTAGIVSESIVAAKESVMLQASGLPFGEAEIQWQFSDGQTAQGASISMVFRTLGLIRVSMLAQVQGAYYLARKNLYVLPNGVSLTKDADTVQDASACDSLFVLMEYRNETLMDQENQHPVWHILQDDENYFILTPAKGAVDQLANQVNDYKYGYVPLEIPLAGSNDFQVTMVGTPDLHKIAGYQVEAGKTSVNVQYVGLYRSGDYESLMVEKPRLVGKNETFSPDRIPAFVDIESIQIKLNYNRGILAEGKPNLLVKICQFDQDITQHTCVFQREMEAKDLIFQQALKIDVDLKSMDTTKQYFVSLQIKEVSKDLASGNFYRWVGKGYEKNVDGYGYFNQGNLKEMAFGWGQAWLKIHTADYTVDMSHSSESLGNRVGYEDFEQFYQVFSLR